MAIRPIIKYPSNVDGSDANYPHGKAKNDAIEGDGSGTPLEKDMLNDIWGFQQQLLDAAGITPSGNPDEVGTSDYFDALTLLQAVETDARIAADAALRAGIPGQATSYRIPISSFDFDPEDATNWGHLFHLFRKQADVSSAHTCTQQLKLPPSCQLIGFGVEILGAVALPAVKPEIALARFQLSGGIWAVADTDNQIDPSTTGAEFGTTHQISKTLGTPWDVTNGSDIIAFSFSGEAGAGAAADTLILYRGWIDVAPPA